jgi:myo-inositol catabolism protein IolS
MEFRRCGNSDLMLPVLGVGAWSFGGGDFWGEQDQGKVDGVVQKALDRGCTLFDTAEMYNDGSSESSLGKALGSRRGEAIIATKVSPHNARPEDLRRSCEASLSRLGTDYIDLYMMHYAINELSLLHYTDEPGSPAEYPTIAAALETMEALRQEGKIRHIGVSNFGVQQLTEALAVGVPIVCNQLHYNLLCRMLEYEILPCCVEHGLGIMTYTPLMQGILTGKYGSLDEIPPKRRRTRHFSSHREGTRHGEAGAEEEMTAALAAVGDVAARSGMPMSVLALSWCLSNPAITCTLTGARDEGQVEANLAALDSPLSPELMAELNELTVPLKEKLGEHPDYFEAPGKSRTY